MNICDFAFTGSVDFTRQLLEQNPQILAADLPKSSIDKIHEIAVSGNKVEFIHFLMSPNHCDEFNGRDLLPWPEKFSLSMTPGMLFECVEKNVVHQFGNYYYLGNEYCEMLWALVERKAIRLLDQIEGKETTWIEYMKKISGGDLALDDNKHPQRVVCVLNEIANGLRVIVLQQVESYLGKRKDELHVNGKKALSFGIRSAIALRERLNSAGNAADIFHVMLQHLGRSEGGKGPGFKDESLDMLIISAIMKNALLNRLLVMRLPIFDAHAQVVALVDYKSFQWECNDCIRSQNSTLRMWSYVSSATNNRKIHEIFRRYIGDFDHYCAGKLHNLLVSHHEDEHSADHVPQ